jgi:hypothetical protein
MLIAFDVTYRWKHASCFKRPAIVIRGLVIDGISDLMLHISIKIFPDISNKLLTSLSFKFI